MVPVLIKLMAYASLGDKMKKPLIITGEPYQDSVQTTIGTWRGCTMIPTNYGPLTVREASRKLEVVPGCLRSRLKRLPWHHPDVVIVGQAAPSGGAKKATRTDTCKGVLSELSGRVRTKNLKKVPELGTWEKGL